MHSKRNFKTVLILLLVTAAGLLLFGFFTKDDQLKRILFGISAGLGLALLVQCVLYAVNPQFFKDKRRPY